MFDTIIQNALTSLPTFALHLAVTLVMLIAGVVIYTMATPINEQKLIAAGNVAASVSFGAIVLSLAIPLAFCLKASVGLADIIVWGAVATVLQLIAFGVATLVFRDMSRRIEAGDMAAAVALSATNLAVAALNAAAISG
jgi:putative membrane protein